MLRSLAGGAVCGDEVGRSGGEDKLAPEESSCCFLRVGSSPCRVGWGFRRRGKAMVGGRPGVLGEET